MRRLALIAFTAPGAAFAHVGHAPVPNAAHGAAHAGTLAGALLVAAAVGAAWLAARRRN